MYYVYVSLRSNVTKDLFCLSLSDHYMNNNNRVSRFPSFITLCLYFAIRITTTLYSTQITYEKKNYCIAFYSILYVFTVVEIKIYYAAIIVEHGLII